MDRRFHVLENENGSVAVIALMVLVLLTIMGFSATDTTDIELGIVRNEAIYRRIFYLAEAPGIEGAQRLERENDRATLLVLTPLWLHDESTDMTDCGTWTSANSAVSLINPNARFAMVDRGVAPGSSMDMTATVLHSYSIYGCYNGSDGQAQVDIGYKKRF